jgi:ribosomal protein S18 acetylase RimI-like enzyme
MNLRFARAEDEAALYEICLRTGDSGADASRLYSDPRLLGEVYVGPYLRLEPGFAFVAEDADGVAGYALGALDTTDFEQRCERLWWPELRRRHPAGSAPVGTPDATMVGLIHQPPRASRSVTERYPSHLHIDLLPRTQGRGVGRLLIEHLLRALSAAGSPGVHLGVGRANERAVGFYRRMGFTVAAEDSDALVMGRSTTV